MKVALLVGTISLLSWRSVALPSVAPPSTEADPSDVLARLQVMSMEALEEAEREMERSDSGSCSLGTAQVRQDWYVRRPERYRDVCH